MRLRAAVGGTAVLAAVVVSGCANPFGRQYEYEEQYYLNTNGKVTVTVDASIPALVALRGLALDPSPAGHTDRQQIRKLYEDAGCRVTRLPDPWRRDGRRFIQVSIQSDDVRELAKCTPLSWSTYSGLVPEEGPVGALGAVPHVRYQQTVGAATPGDPGAVNWTGGEIVAVKLHLPSRILDHNARDIVSHLPREQERGNILTWEQRLSDRRAGTPIVIDVKMDPQSILFRTLWLFAGAFGAALFAMAVVIWLVMRRGRKSAS